MEQVYRYAAKPAKGENAHVEIARPVASIELAVVVDERRVRVWLTPDKASALAAKLAELAGGGR